MERKKTSLLIIGVCALVLSIIGITYAFWQLRLSQTDKDTISSSCFEVTLEKEGTGIYLEKAYPMEDEEGKQLTPYKFTITNTCDANAGYQINLESLEKINGETTIPETDRLGAQYLKVKINEVGTEGMISILGTNDVVTKTLNDAYESHKLMTGYLGPAETDNASKDFELRLWLDGDLTMADEEAMNKTFASKITVTASYLTEEKIPPTIDLELAVCENTIIATGSGTPSGDKSIEKYEFKLDDDAEWKDNNGEQTKEFTGLEKGKHTIKLRVTDNKGATSEFSKQIEVNYEEPTTANLGGKAIELTSSGNGLYRVSHCGVTGTTNDNDFSKEEYRYAGINYAEGVEDYVHNYVTFNGEKWQIIGLVNVQTKDNGITQRLKIIKKDLGIVDEWDYSKMSGGDRIGYNDWTTSSLMNQLNEIDGEQGQYYTKIVTDESKNMIAEDIIWNIGGSATAEDITADVLYSRERGTFTGTSNFPYIWPAGGDPNIKARVGLMYPSDYGYATNGGTLGRENCLSFELYNWDSGDYKTQCAETDWLIASDWTWTLTPTPYLETYDISVFVLDPNGQVFGDNVYEDPSVVVPALYLSTNVQIVNDGNDGSYEKPYNLELKA